MMNVFPVSVNPNSARGETRKQETHANLAKNVPRMNAIRVHATNVGNVRSFDALFTID